MFYKFARKGSGHFISAVVSGQHIGVWHLVGSNSCL